MSIAYPENDRISIPEGADLGLGCGNPPAFGDLKEGMSVLDLGSGAGIDIFTIFLSITESGGCGCECGTESEIVKMSIAYPENDRISIPEGADLGLGCGTPTAFADLKEGMTVLDLGSGAGIDCFVASRYVGKTGKVIGIDMTEEMIKKANENKRKVDAANVDFRLGEIEDLP